MCSMLIRCMFINKQYQKTFLINILYLLLNLSRCLEFTRLICSFLMEGFGMDFGSFSVPFLKGVRKLFQRKQQLQNDSQKGVEKHTNKTTFHESRWPCLGWTVLFVSSTPPFVDKVCIFELCGNDCPRSI